MKAFAANILVIEDEEDLRELVTLHLERDGHRITSCTNAEDAVEVLRRDKNFDLILVDWMLPGMSGLALIESLDGKYPILMITARAAQEDVISALEKGADDYITKPFEIPILQARVNALLRRARFLKDIPPPSQDHFSFKNLSVSVPAHEARLNDEILHLTPSEFRILVALLENRGRVLSRQALIDKVQGEDVSVIARTIDTHVFGLRKKLGDHAYLIETIRGIGYRIGIEA